MIRISEPVPTCPNLSRPLSQPKSLIRGRVPTVPTFSARAYGVRLRPACSHSCVCNNIGVDGWDSWDTTLQSTTYLSRPRRQGRDRLGQLAHWRSRDLTPAVLPTPT